MGSYNLPKHIVNQKIYEKIFGIGLPKGVQFSVTTSGAGTFVVDSLSTDSANDGCWQWNFSALSTEGYCYGSRAEIFQAGTILGETANDNLVGGTYPTFSFGVVGSNYVLSATTSSASSWILDYTDPAYNAPIRDMRYIGSGASAKFFAYTRPAANTARILKGDFTHGWAIEEDIAGLTPSSLGITPVSALPMYVGGINQMDNSGSIYAVTAWGVPAAEVLNTGAGSKFTFTGIACADATHAYAVGHDAANGSVYYFDGASWTNVFTAPGISNLRCWANKAFQGGSYIYYLYVIGSNAMGEAFIVVSTDNGSTYTPILSGSHHWNVEDINGWVDTSDPMNNVSCVYSVFYDGAGSSECYFAKDALTATLYASLAGTITYSVDRYGTYFCGVDSTGTKGMILNSAGTVLFENATFPFIYGIYFDGTYGYACGILDTVNPAVYQYSAGTPPADVTISGIRFKI